ncbi:MAG: DUF3127 domain-containing protein [Firmicutes bacterium]|nr:DUF3127 domain-containing protein [Bacillota bacterium]MCM1401556.1 DUF3127 domain-containing protein [Bacteroides sp.]MCM1477250.1 DUF3127 domain-containing protein [Bacteroides sp.]
MEIKGKVIVALPEQSGVSKAGNSWKKREYVLETQETYPKKVHFDLFGERADQYPLSVGDDITLSFDIESREFNGRWYTSIRGWKVEKGTAAQMAPAPSADPNMPPVPPFDPMAAGGGDEDLPF